MNDVNSCMLTPTFMCVQFLANTKKTVTIFGGSFDPITSGHLNCACEIVHMRKADEVTLVPPRAHLPPGVHHAKALRHDWHP